MDKGNHHIKIGELVIVAQLLYLPPSPSREKINL